MTLAGVGRLLCRTAEGFGRHNRPAVDSRYGLLVGSDVACELSGLYWFSPCAAVS